MALQVGYGELLFEWEFKRSTKSPPLGNGGQVWHLFVSICSISCFEKKRKRLLL